jgi:hypothetical protein
MLGWEKYEPITIPHPLQTLDANLVNERSDGIIEAVIGRLCTRK